MKGLSLGVRKGAWSEEEDLLLKKCIEKYGEGKWHQVPSKAGLNRCRKSCRLRWLNYLKPNIKRGHFEDDEVDLIIRLHKLLGNRWSLIAGRIPGRTANDVKNYWNTHLLKKFNPSSSTQDYSKPKNAHHDHQIPFNPKDNNHNVTINSNIVIKPLPRTLPKKTVLFQLDHHNHHDDNKDINNNNSHVDVIPTASNDLLPEGDSSYCVASDQEDMETMWWENFLVNYESEVVDEQMKKQSEEDTGNCFKYYSYGNTASGIEVGQGDKNQISSDWDQLFCDLTLWNVFNFPEPDTCV